jgi:hypothetical protein
MVFLCVVAKGTRLPQDRRKTMESDVTSVQRYGMVRCCDKGFLAPVVHVAVDGIDHCVPQTSLIVLHYAKSMVALIVCLSPQYMTSIEVTTYRDFVGWTNGSRELRGLSSILEAGR